RDEIDVSTFVVPSGSDGRPRAKKPAPDSRLMQQERGPHVPEARPSGKPSMANFDRVQPPLDVPAPKLKKPAQLREMWRGIELLPDETLQQVGMIGKVVDDLRGRQPTLAKLRLQLAHVAFFEVHATVNRSS